jgi:uncharacterized membrane protein YhhN
MQDPEVEREVYTQHQENRREFLVLAALLLCMIALFLFIVPPENRHTNTVFYVAGVLFLGAIVSIIIGTRKFHVIEDTPEEERDYGDRTHIGRAA